MKKRRTKTQTLVLTGMTSTEFHKFAKDVKHRMLEGVEEIPELRRCYLCKRVENSKAFSYDKETMEPITPKIQIQEVRIKTSKAMTFVFPLCQECLFLLENMTAQALTSG
jgi:hypothetical protein